AASARRIRVFSSAGCSSGTVSMWEMRKPCLRRSSATAGPDRSCLSPRARESLTVRTAAVKDSGVEEDIFLFLGLSTVALGFVEQPEAFHEQALGIQAHRLLRGLALEVNLKVASGPAEHLEHGRVALQRAVGSVRHLAFAKIHFAFLVL